MTPKQMEVFLAFMRTRSTTVAALQLGASQSSVSRALSQLESLLDISLFARRKGQLLPTAQAEALQAPLQSLWEEWQALQRRVAQLRTGEKPRTLLRVHVPGVLAVHCLPQLAAALGRTHPHAVLEIMTGDGRQAESALIAHETDVAVLRLPARHARLRTEALADSAPVCLLPARHPLSRRPMLSADDLVGVGLILPARTHWLRPDVDAYLAAARGVPRLCAQYHCTETAARMVAQGVGVAIADGCLASLRPDSTIEQRPMHKSVSYQLGWARADDAPEHPIGQAFAQYLRAALAASDKPATFRVAPPPGGSSRATAAPC